MGPNAVAIASGTVFWMGKDKFYSYLGRIDTLNCDLRKYIFNDINLTQNEQVFAGTNEGFNEGLPGGVAYGFTLSLVLVAAFAVLVLALFLIVKNKRNQMVALGLGFVLLAVIVYNRYQNMSTNEFCVFNSKQLVFVVKDNQNLLCFYKAKKDDFDKVEKLVDAYRKIYPAEVQYFDLSERNYAVNSESLIVKTTKIGVNWEVKVNSKVYALVVDYESNTSLKGKSIVMPYIESSTSYELSKGAFRAKI